MDDTTHVNDTAQEEMPEEAASADETPQEDQPNDALNMIDLEKTIKNFYAGVQAKREELKKLREMIKHTLETDATFALQQEKIDEAKREQQGTKDQLMATSGVISAREEIRDLLTEVKEAEGFLSLNLLKYGEMTKLTSITMGDGETYEIKQSAKLVKQTSKPY